MKIIITQLSATLFEIAVIDSEYGDRINSCTKKTEKEAMEWCRRHYPDADLRPVEHP